MKLDIKLLDVDSELLIKRLRVRHGPNELMTPTKASFREIASTTGINEIYKKVGLTRIDECVSDVNDAGLYNRQIKREKDASALDFFVVDYPDLQSPSKIQMDYLADLQFSHSDVVVTPTWSTIVKKGKGDLAENYNRLTSQFIERVELLNNKTILGMLSANIPYESLDKVFNNYIKYDVTSFVIDFDRKYIDTNPPWIRRLMVLLNTNDLLETSLLYPINAGVAYYRTSPALARDFICCGVGMDVLGMNHKGVGGRSTTKSKESSPSATQSEPTAKIHPTSWLFDNASYGYLQTRTDPTEQPRERLLRQKEYNIRTQSEEATLLQQKLQKGGSLEPYIKSKKQVVGEIIALSKDYRGIFKA